MYLDVNMGKHGEIVIPAIVRKKFKLKAGDSMILNVTDDRIEMLTKTASAVDRMRAIAKKIGMKSEDILQGDELYEQVF